MIKFTYEEAKHLQCVLADSVWSLERRAASASRDECLSVVKDLQIRLQEQLSEEVVDE